MAGAVQDLLKGENAASVLPLMSSAVSQFEVGDSAYQLFAQKMPRLGVRMPGSQWGLGGSEDEQLSLVGFAQRLIAAEPRSPKHALAIDAVSTDPPALSMEGRVQVFVPGDHAVGDRSRRRCGPGWRKGCPSRSHRGAGARPAPPGGNIVGRPCPRPGPDRLPLWFSVGTQPANDVTVVAEGPGSEGDRAVRVLMVEVPGAGFTGATIPPKSSSGTTTTTTPGPATT